MPPTPKLARVLRAMTGLHAPVVAWAGARDSWPRRRVLWLLDPARTELPVLMSLGALLIGSVWLCLGVLQDLIAGDPLVHADHALLHLLLSLRVGWAAQFAVTISEAGNAFVVLAVAGASLFWLDRRQAWRAMAYAVAAMIGAILCSAGLDLALPRPAPVYRDAGFSLLPFPGAQLAVLTALLGFLTILICRERTARFRIVIAAATVGFIIAMMASRLYLGAVYLSTALEAVAFGGAWAALLGLVCVARGVDAGRAGGLARVIMGAIVVAGAISIVANHRADLRHDALQPATTTMSLADWQHDGWERLPHRRLALLGAFGQPLTVQWLGDPESLRAILTAAGWRRPPAWRPRSLVAFLAYHPDVAHLPVLPQLNDGRAERMVLIRPAAPDRRLVLRLWRSDVLIPVPAGLAQLWIGTLVTERIGTRMVRLSGDLHTSAAPLRGLAASLGGARMVHRQGHTGGVVLAIDPGMRIASP